MSGEAPAVTLRATPNVCQYAAGLGLAEHDAAADRQLLEMPCEGASPSAVLASGTSMSPPISMKLPMMSGTEPPDFQRFAVVVMVSFGVRLRADLAGLPNDMAALHCMSERLPGAHLDYFFRPLATALVVLSMATLRGEHFGFHRDLMEPLRHMSL